ncbi:MAG: hypothetical protein R2755_29130 [Acidimicrobiales bacterium]
MSGKHRAATGRTAMTARTGRAARTARLAAAAIGIVALLGAASCGGDDGSADTGTTIASKEAGSVGGDGTDETDGSSGEEADTADGDGLDVEPIELTVDATGWWGGFGITVDRVLAEPGLFGGTAVTATIVYENLGPDTTYVPLGRVIVDGVVADALPDTPEVPSGGKTEATVAFGLDVELDEAAVTEALGSAQIVFGEAGDNQTKLPLGPGGKVESVEPRRLAVGGTLVHGEVIIDVTGAAVAPSYETGEKGESVIEVDFVVRCSPNCAPSGYNADRSNFSLRSADGLSSVADERSRYCCDAVYPGDVHDGAEHVLSFVVPSPGTGSWTLIFDLPAAKSDGLPPATFTFTV